MNEESLLCPASLNFLWCDVDFLSSRGRLYLTKTYSKVCVITRLSVRTPTRTSDTLLYAQGSPQISLNACEVGLHRVDLRTTRSRGFQHVCGIWIGTSSSEPEHRTVRALRQTCCSDSWSRRQEDFPLSWYHDSCPLIKYHIYVRKIKYNIFCCIFPLGLNILYAYSCRKNRILSKLIN